MKIILSAKSSQENLEENDHLALISIGGSEAALAPLRLALSPNKKQHLTCIGLAQTVYGISVYVYIRRINRT
jgi:hypothetical protein